MTESIARPLVQRSLFDAVVESDLDLPGLPTTAAPDLTIRNAVEPPASFDVRDRIYLSPDAPAGTRGALEAYRLNGTVVLRSVGIVDFCLLGPGEIHWQLHPNAELAEACDIAVGPVLATWLEMRGRLCLHAAGLALSTNASVALLGHSGAGKSSLAASFLAAGCGLVCDDIAAIGIVDGQCCMAPAFPMIRVRNGSLGEAMLAPLAADAAKVAAVTAAFGKSRFSLAASGGLFAATPPPCRALFVLDRRVDAQPDITIVRLAPAQGLAELLRWSFCARLVECLGIHHERMRRLAAIAEAVPMHRLSYPSGAERLPDVRQAILAAVET